MIKMPLPLIVEKIREGTGLTEQDILSRVDEKLNQLSGLISKEGSAHIIANELGVKLFDQVQGRLQIKNILAGMRDVEAVGKVQHTSPITVFTRKDGNQGKVANVVIADETGSIRVVLWGSHADTISSINKDAILKVSSGYIRENNGRIEIHLNEKSSIVIDPEGEKVGDIAAPIAKRKHIADLKDTDLDIEILAHVVQVFEPRFFETCPTCGKRARPLGSGFFCEAHQEVTPVYSFVMTAVLDDGTETLRAVFFRKQAEEFLKMGSESILNFRNSPEGFAPVKSALLGNYIKIVGKAKTNEMFNRLEFICTSVLPDPDPKEELERLKSQAPSQEAPANTQHEQQLPEQLPSVEEI